MRGNFPVCDEFWNVENVYLGQSKRKVEILPLLFINILRIWNHTVGVFWEEESDALVQRIARIFRLSDHSVQHVRLHDAKRIIGSLDFCQGFNWQNNYHRRFPWGRCRHICIKLSDWAKRKTVNQQRLILGGKQFEDAFTLQNYQIKKEDSFTLVFRLRGT